ncbi:MAG: hypothetical protein ACR2MP_24280, partial [Streptosporangiaceae bacterium]
GSALITAMRQVGATIGVAVLGTVLLSAYRSQLDLGGLPAAAAGAVRTGVGAGVGVALHLHSAALLDSVRAAFAHGLDIMLAVCAGIAGLSALLALVFLPRRAGTGGRAAEGAGGRAADGASGLAADGAGVAAATGSGAPLAPPPPWGQDQGHEHARR